MKLTCDLCGGDLQINPGGQSAACMVCDLTYSMERLREKLIVQKMPLADLMPPVPEPPGPPLPTE